VVKQLSRGVINAGSYRFHTRVQYAGLKGLERGVIMARVLVVLKVLPTDVDIDLDDLRRRIAEKLPVDYELKGYDIEPIAFGLKALRLYIFMPENIEGGTEPLENLIQNVDGVGQVEVEVVHRISE